MQKKNKFKIQFQSGCIDNINLTSIYNLNGFSNLLPLTSCISKYEIDFVLLLLKKHVQCLKKDFVDLFLYSLFTIHQEFLKIL